MTGSAVPPSFRLAYVPGVMPGKWVRIWNERFPAVPLALAQASAAAVQDLLLSGEADAGLVRLPVDRTVLSAIPLYTEQTVVVVPRDHLVTAVDAVTPEDLADEILLHPLDDVLEWESLPGRPARERPATTADAVELVAAGIGVLVMPLSLARLHHRRDLTHRPLEPAPGSGVALAWPEAATTDRVEDFIGIVRGRTVNSTRGRTQQQPTPERKRERTDAGPRRTRQGGGSGGRGRRSGMGGTAKNPRRGRPRRGS
ncbi:LysR family transcriptional regulator substrate-binding protein [Streptomyces sp. CHD11]|uniref:LysR family transcriptional regulator substrate-binding protein n=1 Tax=Streptomyces sp. CHD11 TaxID=2741325 RepID=UPI001BFC9128|nr:LysR family transcriptional regulator substrate-binding protein [Streptomyces sp. CHD11]MBT3154057.1 LysR family transcriptional regulator substrate-binding protein [Streptomyces sp. CHD11]